MDTSLASADASFVGENTLDASGVAVASGVYFYRSEAGGTALARKMVLLK